MSKDWTKKVILLKAETTEGTDAAPVVGTNALKVLNYNPNFMDADFKTRNIEKAYFGANPSQPSSLKRGATFSMEMAGQGTAAGTGIPPFMIVNQFAGMNAGVVTGGNSVVQSPVSVVSSCTHWSYLDNLRLQTIGARASMGFTIEDDEFPLFVYTLLGRAPTTLADESTPGTPTLTGYATPVLASTENTTFTLDGYALALRRWEMNNNADLQYRSLIGPVDRVMMRDRPWSGTIVGEVPDLTAKDYFSKIRPGTTMVAALQHGTTAGNIVKIDVPQLYISGNVSLTEEQGQTMFSAPVTALPVSGNDEIVITTK